MGAPRCVLAVEDEALCAALEDAGCRVLPSDHPMAPLDVQQVGPAPIVTDLMPRGEPDGYGWLEALRAWPWTAKLPVLVCSGFLGPEAPAAHRVRQGADATLPKPFELDAFLASIAGCLAGSSADRRGRCALPEVCAVPFGPPRPGTDAKPPAPSRQGSGVPRPPWPILPPSGADG